MEAQKIQMSLLYDTEYVDPRITQENVFFVNSTNFGVRSPNSDDKRYGTHTNCVSKTGGVGRSQKLVLHGIRFYTPSESMFLALAREYHFAIMSGCEEIFMAPVEHALKKPLDISIAVRSPRGKPLPLEITQNDDIRVCLVSNYANPHGSLSPAIGFVRVELIGTPLSPTAAQPAQPVVTPVAPPPVDIDAIVERVFDKLDGINVMGAIEKLVEEKLANAVRPGGEVETRADEAHERIDDVVRKLDDAKCDIAQMKGFNSTFVPGVQTYMRATDNMDRRLDLVEKFVNGKKFEPTILCRICGTTFKSLADRDAHREVWAKEGKCPQPLSLASRIAVKIKERASGLRRAVNHPVIGTAAGYASLVIGAYDITLLGNLADAYDVPRRIVSFVSHLF
jgi:hypothetical protein